MRLFGIESETEAFRRAADRFRDIARASEEERRRAIFEEAMKRLKKVEQKQQPRKFDFHPLEPPQPVMTQLGVTPESAFKIVIMSVSRKDTKLYGNPGW